MEASLFTRQDRLRDGTPVEIRAVRPGDRTAIQEAVGRMSGESIVRRFFAPRSSFSPEEVARFVNVDFVHHVALVAVVPVDGQPRIVAGARYIEVEPGRVEMACAVEDAWQGRGLGTLLLRNLGAIAREQGVREVVADVLAENQPMLRLLRSSGLPTLSGRQAGAVQLTMSLAGGDTIDPPSAKRSSR